MKQLSFEELNPELEEGHGGFLRSTVRGRGARPLSSTLPVHFVLVADPARLEHGSLRGTGTVALIQDVAETYAAKFRVKLLQISVRDEQIHVLLHPSRRSMVQSFFRVLAGQIAQRFESEGHLKPITTTGRLVPGGTRLWKYRPWSRVLTPEQMRRLGLAARSGPKS